MNCQHDENVTDGWFWMPVEYVKTKLVEVEQGVRFASDEKEVSIKLLPRMTHVCLKCGWVFPFEAFVESSMDELEIVELLTTWGEDLMLWHNGDAPPTVFHIDEAGCSSDYIEWHFGGEDR